MTTIDFPEQHAVLAFLLRVILGLLFFFQGYDKVFRIGIAGVTEFFREESEHRRIPVWILRSSAFLTSYIELIGGALLMIGFLKTYALYMLGFDLILVCGAFSLLKPMWDMQLVFPRLVLLTALLYLPSELDVISVDALIWSY
jgi:uncharacterized membrane protein YphA (DoxX/SURF4 family)